MVTRPTSKQFYVPLVTAANIIIKNEKVQRNISNLLWCGRKWNCHPRLQIMQMLEQRNCPKLFKSNSKVKVRPFLNVHASMYAWKTQKRSNWNFVNMYVEQPQRFWDWVQSLQWVFRSLWKRTNKCNLFFWFCTEDDQLEDDASFSSCFNSLLRLKKRVTVSSFCCIWETELLLGHYASLKI